MVYPSDMRILAVVTTLLAATPAFAAATDWQELAPGARARVISSDTVSADGTVRLGLEIDMPHELKTYWRIPGETGIPTSFDFSRSSGVGAASILWPYPEIEHTPDYTDFVYRGPTVIPFELPAAGPATVGLDVVMGICSDICVPAQASFTLPLSLAKPDPGQSLRIDQAVANLPIPAPDDAVIGEVTLAHDALSVPVHSFDIDPYSVIAAAGDPAVLFGAPQKSPDNGIVILPLLGGNEESLVGQRIDIIYMTPAGPYWVERKIAAAGSTRPAG